MIRKVLLIVVFVLTIMSAMQQKSYAAVYRDNVGVYINGTPVVFPDQKPLFDPYAGRTFVPVRFVSESLGAQVGWDAQEQKVIISNSEKTISLVVGSHEVKVNDEIVTLETPVFSMQGRTMVPLRFVSQSLGAEVQWTPLGSGGGIVDIFLGSYTLKLIGQSSISFASMNTNVKNAGIALAKINGLKVAPGEIFSFNRSAGPYTSSRGYLLGFVYSGKDVVKGVGGGVCRSSTLLYLAALDAKLPVVERHRHSMPVDYVKGNRDATVSYGALDLRFQNDRSNPLVIYTASYGKTIFSRLYEEVELKGNDI